MVGAVRNRQLPVSALFLVAFVVAGFLLFWRTDSPLSAASGIDLDFLFPPLALWALFMLLSLLAEYGKSTGIAALTWRPTRSSKGLRSVDALSFAQRLLTDLAWFALALAILATVPTMIDAVEARAGGPDLSWLKPYVGVLRTMGFWGILLMLPVAAVRALAEARPELGALLPSPWSRIAALGAGFALLASGGVLDVAFGFNGTAQLLALAGVLGISYMAHVVRNVLCESPPQRLLLVFRAQLLLAEATWVTVALGAVAGWPSSVEPVLLVHFGLDAATANAYLEGLRALTSWQAFAVLLPLGALRVAGVFWPTVERMFGFPVGRLAMLGGVFVLCSDNGVLPAAFGVSTSQFVTVVTLAIALSYAASVIRNVASLELFDRFGPVPTVVLTLAGSAVIALAEGVTVWVVLNHLPVANAALVDHEATRVFGRDALPYFNVFFDARVTIAALSAAVAFVLSLPWSSGDNASIRHRPLLNAVSYGAAGCLAWAAGSTLSPLGHGFVLAAAAGAAGMFALAIAQALGYVVTPRSAALGPVARWLAASWLRTFVLGASAATYVLLLRPVLYETLWFAALYEYIALLAGLVLALAFVMDLLRRDPDAPGAREPVWSEWSHHQQTLESKEDPRAALTSDMRREFIEYGEWKPLWSYLMGLLYRNGASREWMRAVCRPLRTSAVSSQSLAFLRRSNLRKLGRLSALAEALRRVDGALAAPEATERPVTEEELRGAAAQYVDTGVGIERLAIALIVAQGQRGRDLQAAIDQWFPLLDAPDPAAGRISLPWAGSGARLRDRRERMRHLTNASAEVFGGGEIASESPDPAGLAELVGASESRFSGA